MWRSRGGRRGTGLITQTYNEMGKDKIKIIFMSHCMLKCFKVCPLSFQLNRLKLFILKFKYENTNMKTFYSHFILPSLNVVV